MLKEKKFENAIHNTPYGDSFICIVNYNKLDNNYGKPTLSYCWYNSEHNYCVFKLLFSINKTKEYIYNIEEFEYQRNFPDECLGHCISKFMLHFVSCTMAAGITPPKDAKYFSVHFSEYSYLKHLMPPLDKKEDGISYFIWQESK